MKVLLSFARWEERKDLVNNQLRKRYRYWRDLHLHKNSFEKVDGGWILHRIPVELATEFILMGVAEIINE